MILLENFKEDDLDNHKLIYKVLTETAAKNITGDLKRFFADVENRKSLLAEHGDNAFLKPEELRYPLIHPKTGKYDCQLVYSSAIGAIKEQDAELIEKVKDLILEHNCLNQIKVQIEGHSEPYDLFTLLDMLVFNFEGMGEALNES